MGAGHSLQVVVVDTVVVVGVGIVVKVGVLVVVGVHLRGIHVLHIFFLLSGRSGCLSCRGRERELGQF